MLRLSPAQEEQLLHLRKKHLRNLRNLFEDRQRLNLSVGPCFSSVSVFSAHELRSLWCSNTLNTGSCGSMQCFS